MSIPALQQPAGLSSDTLEPPAVPYGIQDDVWSDGHDAADTDDDRDVIEEVTDSQDELTIRPPKMSTDKTNDMNPPSLALSSPHTSQDLPHGDVETGSVHSLPVVQVTEPASPAAPMTSRSTSSTYPSSPSTLAPTSTSSLDRRTRNRATLDVSILPATPMHTWTDLKPGSNI